MPLGAEVHLDTGLGAGTRALAGKLDQPKARIFDAQVALEAVRLSLYAADDPLGGRVAQQEAHGIDGMRTPVEQAVAN